MVVYLDGNEERTQRDANPIHESGLVPYRDHALPPDFAYYLICFYYSNYEI